MDQSVLAAPDQETTRLRDALTAQARQLFHPLDEPPSPTERKQRRQQHCATVDVNAFRDALERAPLSAVQKREISAIQQLTFQHTRLSADGHFMLKWDTTGSLAVSDSIVNDAEADLAAAYISYSADFGQPPCASVLDVLFDNARTPQALLPDGPMSLPAAYMNTYSADALQRRLTAVHELFHVLQGGFGYQVMAFNKWFLEGGATWAEAAYYNAITGGEKLRGLFRNPLQKLVSTLYTSLPFLIFLENFFAATKTGRYFMVDWLKAFPHRPPDANPLEELNQLAPQQRSGFEADRLLVQFGLQMALGNWYKQTSGVQAIPQFRDATEPGYPPIPYASQTITLPKTNISDFVNVTDPALQFTPRLRISEFYFLQVTASSAVTPYTVIGAFATGQRKNAYVGAAIVNAHTGAPAPGHSQVAESTALGPRTFVFNSDSETAFFVTTGGHDGQTSSTLITGPQTP